MNLFDKLVNEALKNNNELSSLRMVVEKELLHHDILRTLSETGLLAQLTFIGGTCLRTCYGAKRLSEDLNFTGGADFNRETLSHMAFILTDTIKTKYGFNVKVKEPIKQTGNVDTWSLQIQTREKNKDLPAQRINIDICAIPSYQIQPMFLLNPYHVDMGTSGLIIQAQSLEEIFIDKLLAFSLYPNRIKYRDLWDIFWLHTQNIKPAMELISFKLQDRHLEISKFLLLFEKRLQLMKDSPQIMEDFQKEIQRFISVDAITGEYNIFWKALVNLIGIYYNKILR